MKGLFTKLLLPLAIAATLTAGAAPRTVAEYAFDARDGKTLRDRSGKRHHPLNPPGETRFVKGDPGALRFAADGDGIMLPAAAFPGRRGALEMVAMLEKKPEEGSRPLVSFYSDKGDCFSLSYRKNRLGCGFYDRSAKKWFFTVGTRPLPTDRFVRIGLTWQLPGTIRLTVDGKPAGSVEVDVTPDFIAKSKFSIGSDYRNKDVFPGLVRSLKFFDAPELPAAPTPAPVPKAAATPTAKAAPTAKSLVVAEYVFDVHIDEELKDLSGNGNHPLNSPGESRYAKGTPDTLRFDAEGDGVRLPSAAFPGAQGTIEMVLQLDAKPADARPLLDLYSPKKDNFVLMYRKNRLVASYYRRSEKKWYTTVGVKSLPLRRLVTVTATWELPGTIRLFINGNPAGSVDVDGKPDFAPDAVLTLGGNHLNKSILPGRVRSLKLLSKPVIPSSAPKSKKSAPTAVKTCKLGGMELAFSAANLNLVGWRCAGVEYVNAAAGDGLWEMRLYDRKNKRNISVGPDDAAGVSFRAMPDRAELIWRGVALPDGNRFDVTAAVLASGENELDWRIATGELPERFAADSLTYPRIPCRPTSKDPKEMFICYPRLYGMNAPDAFAFGSKQGKRFGNMYPGGSHYQFCYLYGKDVPGIYLHTDDARGNCKEFIFYSRPEDSTFLLTLIQYPMQRSISREFRSAYPVRTAIISGDWYDAAKRYRRWAIQQPWCAKGTLAQRRGSDIPEWAYHAHIALRPSTLTGFPRDIKKAEARVALNRNDFTRIIRELRCGGLSVWYNYDCAPADTRSISSEKKWMSSFNARPEQQLVPGVAEAVAQLKAAGIGTFGYINSRIYDESPDPNHADTNKVRPWVMRNLDGSYQRYSNTPFDVCRHARGWQEKLLGIIRHDSLANGFAGMYLDSFGRGQYFCWADNHGHLPGSATASVAGQRVMAEYIRSEMRKSIPGFVTCSEASVENFVDLIDFKLHHENIYEHAAPVWAAIYHDRQFVFGRNTNSGFIARVRISSCFHIGAILGRIFCGNKNDMQEKVGPVLAPFYRQFIAMRKRFYPQVGIGEMLRPPVVKSDQPDSVTQAHKVRIRYSAVNASAWRSEDGKAVAFFDNHTDRPANFTFTLDAKELPGKPRHWVVSDGEGNLSEKPYTGNSFTLPPLSVAALEF